MFTLPNGIQYQLQLSAKRKSISIQIHFQDVIVKAPTDADQNYIHNFVLSKQEWIKRKMIGVKPDIDFNQYQLNGLVWYMGKQYKILCNTKQKNIGLLLNNEITLKANPNDATQIQQQYLKWLHHQANRMMPDLVTHCLTRLNDNKHPKVKSITCKRTQSKWGHCTSDQRLQFNWIILMAPPMILEYLICHEIAHLIEKNHSKKFWRLTHSLCEHTQYAEQWLKKNAEVLMRA
ncbi:M48 family metallopeptidase [Marinicellulosiphila megalodicopiae]|uniref:M48 family metallopeptidase n=1 Tax=Marinicellulosiphila megalodicopiae TaxID=2724896 RepID=UPI003BAE55A5